MAPGQTGGQQNRVKAGGWAGLVKAGCRARGRGLVQFPRSFVLKCAWRGSAHAPTIVPEASTPQVVIPTGQDDGLIFQLVLLQGGVWVGGLSESRAGGGGAPGPASADGSPNLAL